MNRSSPRHVFAGNIAVDMNMTEHEPALTRSAAVANAARRLQVKYRPIGDLYLDPKNARLHRAKQVRQIADSIKAFGFNVPILTDAGGQIIAGHGRFLAARRLGLTEAPTIRIEHLTAPQRRAFMIADNRLTEISQWDDRLLAEQLKELSELDLSFDLEATGFDIGEIDLRIESSLRASHPLKTRKRRYRPSQARRSIAPTIFGSSEATRSCAAARSMRSHMPP